MASKTLRKQFAAVAFLEGFVGMIWDQHYSKQPNNKTFSAIRERVIRDCAATMRELVKEGTVSDREFAKIKTAVEQLADKSFHAGQFEPMHAVSFCLGIISDQIYYTRNGKQELFKKLFLRCRELERYFDNGRKYQSAEGFDAAVMFEGLDI